MYETNKEQFGRFVAEQRKKRNLTQKELAEKLFVSDKTVSKWERGGSFPDISLLVPLSEALNVTVTELLEAQETEKISDIDNGHLETLLKKAVLLSKDTPEMRKDRKKKSTCIFGICILLAALEIVIFHLLNYSILQAPLLFLLLFLLSIMFSVILWLFVDDHLPYFYSQHEVRSGFFALPFRQNTSGFVITRKNWPHIIHAARIWTVASMLALPLLYVSLCCFPALLHMELVQVAIAILYFGTLFLSMILASEKI